jgi:hypothetical protein
VGEADQAAGELGVVEGDPAPSELGAQEVTAVKDGAGEIEVQALPGHRGTVFEVCDDEPDEGMADFAAAAEVQLLLRPSVAARIRLVGQAQVCAQDINTGLPVRRPVIGEARHGIHPGQPDRRRLVTA